MSQVVLDSEAGPNLLVVLEVLVSGVVASVRLNGVELFAETRGERRLSQLKVNGYAFSGSNHLVAAVGAPPVPADADRTAFEVRLIVGKHGSEPGPEAIKASFAWDPASGPLAPARVERVWETEVELDVALPRWSWLDAPRSNDGSADRAAITSVVERLHAALSARDVAAFEQETEVKISELALALGVQRAELVADQREYLENLFQAHDWRMAPLQPEALDFSVQAEGRLVRITGAAGAPALLGWGGEQVLALSPLTSRVQGRWTVVR